jgi:hypothetical protein
MDSTAAGGGCDKEPTIQAKRPFGESSDFCPLSAPAPLECDTGSLEHYIRRAELDCFGKFKAIRLAVFSTSSQCSSRPVLLKDWPNRILVFGCCCNSPHFGHLELLVHVFLRTDRGTVAAILIPVFDAPGGKRGAMVKGKDLSLNKDQRSVLLQDELLSRFSWTFKGDHELVAEFQEVMVRLAEADGYELSFTRLAGSDHYAIGKEPWGWGDENLITSDITRPA